MRLHKNRIGASSLLAVTFAAMTFWSFPTLAADTSLCDFVAKISAGRAKGFEAYRGVQFGQSDPKVETDYIGTLLPPGGVHCQANIPADTDALFGPTNSYGCNLSPGTFLSFLQADSLYDKMVAALRACFPKAVFKESKDGEPNSLKESFGWATDVTLAGYSVSVQMGNAQGLVASAMNKIPITPETPAVSVALWITDATKIKLSPKTLR